MKREPYIKIICGCFDSYHIGNYVPIGRSVLGMSCKKCNCGVVVHISIVPNDFLDKLRDIRHKHHIGEQL